MTIPDSKFNTILRNVSRHVTLTEKETAVFRSFLSLRRIRKRQYLLQEGDVCRYESFVVTGCLRAYYVDRDGFEHITMFATEEWWVSDFSSLLTGTPAKLAIDALEDSELLQISRSGFDELCEKVPKFDRFFRILLQNAFIAHEQRILGIIAHTAEERYHDFAARHPAFLQRIPQKHIAAYLGITPEFLSRIRRKTSRPTR